MAGQAALRVWAWMALYSTKKPRDASPHPRGRAGACPRPGCVHELASQQFKTLVRPGRVERVNSASLDFHGGEFA
jgi:hypothetical protein